ncbi:MAG TPA: DUF6114 domain-containing protein [Ktedonobacteraceae bacterium]|nr:DUF6114 domain-containing protein [Ktedonobacteraceae bacterium]
MDDSQGARFEESATDDSPTERIAAVKLERLTPPRFNETLRRLVLSVRERIQVYRARFRLWRLRRPFWGSILMLIAGALILWGPVSLMRFALFPGNTIWAGLLVGALLFVMGLIQLFAPTYAVITGAIAIVLSLVSLIVAMGGLVIGMLLGITGGALGVAWKANAQPLSTSVTRTRTRSRLHLPNLHLRNLHLPNLHLRKASNIPK